LNPAGGAGALSAIQDAVALANLICALQSKKMADVQRIFKKYRAERYPIVKEAVATSQMFKTLGGKVIKERKRMINSVWPAFDFFFSFCLNSNSCAILGILG
jgi:2-polyprenyl-6-methoxyphenol hydroxylase-like FAD-dependent oxidoreductase